MAGTLYILTGPSGVGKTTVARKLLAKRPSLKKVVTCTTRSPRSNETDGVDYHFVSEEVFKQMIEAKELYEWAHVYGRYYGSRISDVEALLSTGDDVLMVIDVQGAREIKNQHSEVVVIFLEAESPKILLERLLRRDYGNTTNLEERKEAFDAEMSFCQQCEYRVLNRENKVKETVQEILDIMTTRS